MKKLLIVLALACTLSSLYAQKTCYSELKGDTLVIGNECIERKFIWNGGNLITYSLSDKVSRKTTFTVKQTPDFFISKDTREASNGTCRVEKVDPTEIHPYYLKTILKFSMGTMDIQRI